MSRKEPAADTGGTFSCEVKLIILDSASWQLALVDRHSSVHAVRLAPLKSHFDATLGQTAVVDRLPNTL